MAYVPSTRAVRTAWTLATVVFAAVVLGLVYATVDTALDLQRTNARLDRSEVQKQALIRRMQSHGFALSFVKDGQPRGTYICKLTAGESGYTCTSNNRTH